eukprot:CAMPEP_0118677744 /NCGR_PEP_ID=MMETSP0800-20121206/2805_1 /TAXON_ID=210618 ORGANISM="Striatella unipunctata, Strain CCMP2910" /NCGR_SAMPLE_ID=MMETSP0800 /ASSEMBLY_ACC=CAM_ASM_000638 /LENGTH=128 /DNA_ID=CAMNT_0006573467 /DNA_START=104 /DNA_END=490 /DNA_ORIENTATION=-
MAPGYREDGMDGAMKAANTYEWEKNNGAATYLTIDPENGLGEYFVFGKTYVVRDDGRYPLSKEQVWGMTELIHSCMDGYGGDPAKMPNGKKTLEACCKKYKEQKWEHPDGIGADTDIYSPRKVVYETK